jgi:hypothetical protein
MDPRSGIIKLQTNPRGFLVAYTRAGRRGFNMINVIKNLGEVASPKINWKIKNNDDINRNNNKGNVYCNSSFQAKR